VTGVGYAWTLDEYVLRVELGDESLREIVAEGSTDRAFLEGFLEDASIDDVVVLDATYISVPPENVVAAGFNAGVKGALLTLSMRLGEVRPFDAVVAVVVDRDFDGLPVEHANDFLLATDYYSMEGYALTETALNRFARGVLMREARPPGRGGAVRADRGACSGADLIERLAPALTEIAAVRRLLRRMNPPASTVGRWVDYFTVGTNGFFESRGAALLSSSLRGRSTDVGDLDNAFREECASVEAEDLRLSARGRDFISLLLKLLRSPWGRRISSVNFAVVDEPTVTTWLLGAVSAPALRREPLFQALEALFRLDLIP